MYVVPMVRRLQRASHRRAGVPARGGKTRLRGSQLASARIAAQRARKGSLGAWRGEFCRGVLIARNRASPLPEDLSHPQGAFDVSVLNGGNYVTARNTGP
jgi:hypothetical protein